MSERRGTCPICGATVVVIPQKMGPAKLMAEAGRAVQDGLDVERLHRALVAIDFPAARMHARAIADKYEHLRAAPVQDGFDVLRQLHDAVIRYSVAVGRAPANYSEQDATDAFKEQEAALKAAKSLLAAAPLHDPVGEAE